MWTNIFAALSRVEYKVHDSFEGVIDKRFSEDSTNFPFIKKGYEYLEGARFRVLSRGRHHFLLDQILVTVT